MKHRLEYLVGDVGLTFYRIFRPRTYNKIIGAAAARNSVTLEHAYEYFGFPRAFFRFENSEYGFYLWIGRIRLGSYGTMTPMWPRIYTSADEYCNSVLCLRLYPLVNIDIWWRPKQRTALDGMCDDCKTELRESGWTEEQIRAEEHQLRNI